MNKRQAKKKKKCEEKQIEIWGWPMSYKEQRRLERAWHENNVVNNYRNKAYDYELEEIASMIGATYVHEDNMYKYPNRMRFKTLMKN